MREVCIGAVEMHATAINPTPCVISSCFKDQGMISGTMHVTKKNIKLYMQESTFAELEEYGKIHRDIGLFEFTC